MIKESEVICVAKSKGNINNLDPVKTKEEAKRRGRAGGIRSGEVKRINKTIKQLAVEMLNSKIDECKLDENAIAVLDKLNVNKDDFSAKAIMLAGMINKATSGDSQAYDRVCKAIGEEEAAGDDAVKINITVGGVPIDKKEEEK